MDENRVDMIVEITDIDKNGENRKNLLPRPMFPAAIIALWNMLFEIIAGAPYIGFMSWVGDDFGAGGAIIGGLVFAAAHTAASTALYKKYEQHGVPEWKFVLLNALPMFIICAMMFFVLRYLSEYGSLGFGAAIFFGILIVCFVGYSVVYGVILSITLGIRHSVKKGK